ncbi:amino acid ABC transporter substrate-binding protein [Kingella kingae]|uniref:amino acid ABC transporter substrate-binding protein n=1 Tax=Kingella kingae TaxID=504 RepID=UPI0002585017|nr:amino acid ABC transporter substrate-binding protein [Kingella kingae]EIC14266.1 ArtI protein [Kingella kingae PYKK081]MDK4525537.1 amino acid ABC transporter substrate-binding protein [Kingella kingae]MDK4528061.1 amino acid ABC transporter substrate-binding protein [Kingella kingae]MDK4529940.1 amino acid ABC transporter substrate-binding protein [Kingella kingae]MDK4531520.1 amino acid ABC transporter substrate-binding protein [Kingella kingae]
MLKPLSLSLATALLLAACGQANQETKQPAQGSAPVAAASEATVATANGSLIERINNKGVITVGTEGTYAPYTYHDASGKLTGYDVEVTRAVAAKLGVQVEFKETQWDAMMAGLKGGRFDLVANQVALTSPERQATFDKAEPYSWSGPSILAREDETRVKDLSSIKGLRAAQTLSSNYGETAVKAEAEIVPVDGMAQAITLVQQKRADVTLNDTLSFLDYLKKNPNSGLKIVWTAPSAEKKGAGLILNKGNDEALAKISAAMVELQKDSTLRKLGEEFFGQDISVK